jgi:hypothetical protein
MWDTQAQYLAIMCFFLLHCISYSSQKANSCSKKSPVSAVEKALGPGFDIKIRLHWARVLLMETKFRLLPATGYAH